MDFVKQFNFRAMGKARPRFARGHAYTPSRTRAFEQAVATLLRVELSHLGYHAPTALPVRIAVTAYFKLPKASTKAFRQRVQLSLVPYDKKPDADNILKAILDACNGVVFVDDKQCFISCEKYYAERDYFVVAISDNIGTSPQPSRTLASYDTPSAILQPLKGFRHE